MHSRAIHQFTSVSPTPLMPSSVDLHDEIVLGRAGGSYVELGIEQYVAVHTGDLHGGQLPPCGASDADRGLGEDAAIADQVRARDVAGIT